MNCYYHLYGECSKEYLRVKDEACVYYLERALEDISFAASILSGFLPTTFFH